MMRKGKLCFVLLFLVLFYWPNLALSHTDLFLEEDIDIIGDDEPPLILPNGDEADVYYPNVHAAANAFPIVAFLQGAGVDKSFYTVFGTQLARYGFVVVIPNHFVVLGPPDTPPVLFPDEFVIFDILAQIFIEDNNPTSSLFGIVDTSRVGLAGHSAGGAASLFAIDGSCQFPFCGPPPPTPSPPFPPLPGSVRAGAFYGTNTFPLCIPDPDNPCPPKMPIDVNTNDFPVALVQGTADSIATPEEGKATFNILDGVRAFIPIPGANHYGITDENNPEGAQPDFSFPEIRPPKSAVVIANATGRFLRTHLGIELSVSSSADRSNTMLLEGATLSGEAFIFLTPLYPHGNIEQVYFFLDRSFVKTEFWAPYDLKGTFRGGKPAPFNTRTLKDGPHTLRAEIVFPTGVQSIESEFTTRNYESKPADFRLSVSSSADRSGTIPLGGANLSGDAFIFLTPLFPDEDIDEVDFFLDGLFVKTESWAPYDLKGTRDGGIPVPFDTRTLDNGSHTVRAEIELSTGDVERVASRFLVSNEDDDD